MKNFVLIGAAGYIAPRHMKAIKDTGNNLIAAYDPYDGIGIMDSYFPKTSFFTEFERFDRHLEKLKRGGVKLDYVSICSPNYLHDAHIRYGLRIGADVICEKPVVLNPWNIDALQELENGYPNRVNTILQLRHHEEIIKLKRKIDFGPKNKIYDVDLNYITSRGNWYYTSWKGDINKSGGIAFKIEVDQSDTCSGFFLLNQARVNWFLSINQDNLPDTAKRNNLTTYRSLSIEGDSIEFSKGFKDLHNLSYQKIIEGNGFGLSDSRSSIELVSLIRNKE